MSQSESNQIAYFKSGIVADEFRNGVIDSQQLFITYTAKAEQAIEMTRNSYQIDPLYGFNDKN